jgi:hypothetical protein
MMLARQISHSAGGKIMAIPKTMKAAVVKKFGDPLVVQEVPVPSPGPGQALVEIMPAESVTQTCTPPTVIGP